MIYTGTAVCATRLARDRRREPAQDGRTLRKVTRVRRSVSHFLTRCEGILMSSMRLHRPLILMALVAGCSPPQSAKNAPSQSAAATSSSGAATVAVGNDPQQTFLAAFREANAKKEVDAMLALYCWSGVDSETRETVRGNVQDELLQPVTDLKIVPAEPGKHDRTVEGGVRWRTNLPVAAVLKVQYAPAKPGTGLHVSSAEHLLGLQGGEYKIVVPVRE